MVRGFAPRTFLIRKDTILYFFRISLYSVCGDIVSDGGAEAAYFGCENDEKNWYDNCKYVLQKKESESEFYMQDAREGYDETKILKSIGDMK